MLVSRDRDERLVWSRSSDSSAGMKGRPISMRPLFPKSAIDGFASAGLVSRTEYGKVNARKNFLSSFASHQVST